MAELGPFDGHIIVTFNICYPRIDEIGKLKLKFKISGEKWRKVGKNHYLCT